MKLIATDHCTRNWDFQPRNTWSSILPPYAWRKHLIAGFSSEQNYALELDENNELSLCEVWAAVHPELSLPELARFYVRAQQDLSADDWQGLFKHHGLRFHPGLSKTLYRIAQAPLEFQNWVSHRGLSPRDLAPLASLPNNLPTHLLAENLYLFIAKLNPSRQQGTQGLEWAAELLLMERKTTELTGFDTIESWLKHLQSMRYPQATHQDAQLATATQRLSWPLHTRAQWRRDGDQTYVDLQLSVQSVDDLQKKIHGLQQVLKQMQEAPEDLWKN